MTLIEGTAAEIARRVFTLAERSGRGRGARRRFGLWFCGLRLGCSRFCRFGRRFGIVVGIIGFLLRFCLSRFGRLGGGGGYEGGGFGVDVAHHDEEDGFFGATEFGNNAFGLPRHDGADKVHLNFRGAAFDHFEPFGFNYRLCCHSDIDYIFIFYV